MIEKGISGLCVLVVEDEALIAEDLCERLTRLGTSVVGPVDTADAAVETAIRTRPDIVLMDVRLRGERDGIAAANDIRDAIQAPVVFLTSHADRATLERAKGSTPFGYVLKPFDERELFITLEMVSQRHATERALKRAQEELFQAQKMESIGRLASGIAHDFNNLLTVINGCAEIALWNRSLSDTTRSLLTEVVQAGRGAASLTRQFLAFGRKGSLRPQSLDLNTLVADRVAMLHRLIHEDIELSLELAPVPVVAFVDPTQVEQIITNLVVNARDAMPNGGCITVGTRIVHVSQADAREVGAEPGCYAVLAISDTGTGIDEAIREHLFEPYFTTKDVGAGRGLGLATVYGIAKQTGGSVTVRSALGQGATFAVYLPAMPTASAAVKFRFADPGSRQRVRGARR